MGTGELVEEAIERSHIAGNLLKKTMSPGATALTAEQLESVLEDLTASRAGEQDVKGFLGAHPPAALPGTLDALAAVYNAYVDWRAGSGGGGGGGGASADPLAALQAAMEADDADALEEAIDAGADANAKLGDAPAITVAAEHGCLDLIQVLLEKGASVDAARPDGSTALILAAANSHQEVVENLVQRGASVGATRADGASALTLATHDEIKALLHEASDEHGLDEQLAMPAAAAPKPKKGPGRRSSVSAESVDPTKTQTQAKKVIEKAEEDKERIRATLRKCFLFKNSDAMQITDLVCARRARALARTARARALARTVVRAAARRDGAGACARCGTCCLLPCGLPARSHRKTPSTALLRSGRVRARVCVLLRPPGCGLVGPAGERDVRGAQAKGRGHHRRGRPRGERVLHRRLRCARRLPARVCARTAAVAARCAVRPCPARARARRDTARLRRTAPRRRGGRVQGQERRRH